MCARTRSLQNWPPQDICQTPQNRPHSRNRKQTMWNASPCENISTSSMGNSIANASSSFLGNSDIALPCSVCMHVSPAWTGRCWHPLLQPVHDNRRQKNPNILNIPYWIPCLKCKPMLTKTKKTKTKNKCGGKEWHIYSRETGEPAYQRRGRLTSSHAHGEIWHFLIPLFPHKYGLIMG